MKKHEMIEQIQNNSLGSIYSKEDVIRLMEQIEAEPAEIKINPKMVIKIRIFHGKKGIHYVGWNVLETKELLSVSIELCKRNTIYIIETGGSGWLVRSEKIELFALIYFRKNVSKK